MTEYITPEDRATMLDDAELVLRNAEEARLKQEHIVELFRHREQKIQDLIYEFGDIDMGFTHADWIAAQTEFDEVPPESHHQLKELKEKAKFIESFPYKVDRASKTRKIEHE